MHLHVIENAPLPVQDERGVRGATCVCRSVDSGIVIPSKIAFRRSSFALTGETRSSYGRFRNGDSHRSLCEDNWPDNSDQRRGFHHLSLSPHTHRRLSERSDDYLSPCWLKIYRNYRSGAIIPEILVLAGSTHSSPGPVILWCGYLRLAVANWRRGALMLAKRLASTDLWALVG